MMKLKKQYINILLLIKIIKTKSKYNEYKCKKNNNNPPKKLLIFNIVMQEIKNQILKNI